MKLSIKIVEPKEKPDYMLCMLPGRGVNIESTNRYLGTLVNKKNILKLFIENENLTWYSMPNGPKDQDLAVKDLNENYKIIENRISSIAKAYKINQKNIILYGYSAGGVLCYKLASNGRLPYKFIITHASVVLDCSKLKKNKKETKIVSFYNLDDHCFSYYERYLPSKEWLIKNKYNVHFVEEPSGGHGIYKEDCYEIARLIKEEAI